MSVIMEYMKYLAICMSNLNFFMIFAKHTLFRMSSIKFIKIARRFLCSIFGDVSAYFSNYDRCFWSMNDACCCCTDYELIMVLTIAYMVHSQAFMMHCSFVNISVSVFNKCDPKNRMSCIINSILHRQSHCSCNVLKKYTPTNCIIHFDTYYPI